MLKVPDNKDNAYKWVQTQMNNLVCEQNQLELNNIVASALVCIASENIDNLDDKQRETVEWHKHNWAYNSIEETQSLIKIAMGLAHWDNEVDIDDFIKDCIVNRMSEEGIPVYNYIGDKSRKLMREYKKIMERSNRSEILFGVGMKADITGFWKAKGRETILEANEQVLNNNEKYRIIQMLNQSYDKVSIDDVEVNMEEYEFHKEQGFKYCKLSNEGFDYKKMQKICIWIEMKIMKDELHDIPSACLDYYNGNYINNIKYYLSDTALKNDLNMIYDKWASKITDEQVERYKILVR